MFIYIYTHNIGFCDICVYSDISNICYLMYLIYVGAWKKKQKLFLVESAVALQPAWTCDQRKCFTWRQIVTEQNHQIQLRPLPILILILLVMLTTPNVEFWLGRLNPFSTLPCYGIEYWPKDAKLIQVHNFQLRLLPEIFEISRLGSTWMNLDPRNPWLCKDCLFWRILWGFMDCDIKETSCSARQEQSRFYEFWYWNELGLSKHVVQNPEFKVQIVNHDCKTWSVTMVFLVHVCWTRHAASSSG